MRKNLPKFNDSNYVHFITAKTFQNKSYFKDEKCCLILLEELDFYRKKLGFKILGYVIMPNHFHCLIFWEVDKYPKLTIGRIMQSVKSHSAKEILHYVQTGKRKSSLSPYSMGASEGSHLPILKTASEGSRLLDLINSYSGSWKPSLPDHYKWKNTGKTHTASKTKFWQSGFYDFNIYTDEKLKEKFDYIHDNPIKAGLCQKSEDYRWSSCGQIMETDNNSFLKVDVL